MFTRTRYQQGCLTIEKRKTGPDVWVYLWREIDTEGKRAQRKLTVGTVKQFRSKSAAEKAIASMRAEINQGTKDGGARPLTLEQVIVHYTARHLDSEQSQKAYSTREAYRHYINRWIKPRWGSLRLSEVKTTAVEEWLFGLKLANGTKAKIRNVMSALYTHARRYEFTDCDPIGDVVQSAVRERTPDILSPEEVRALLAELSHPYLAMVTLAAVTGLRRSELFALKWADIDFDAKEIRLSRAVVHQVVGGMKTQASQKPVSMQPELAEVLKEWKGQTKYSADTDWVFASPESEGTQPYWPENVLRRHIRPAAERAGILKRVGFHTFRHTLATVLLANGENIKTTQEILRHATSRVTLDMYAQALTPVKRQAQQKVLQMVLPSERPEALEAYSGA